MARRGWKGSEVERFLTKVELVGECLVWTAAKDENGYGLFRPSTARTVRAHRWWFERDQGALPFDVVVDHRCRNRACVRRAHLRELTDEINILIGDAPPARNARKTHCDHGHQFDEINTYRRPNGNRDCRQCLAIRLKRYRRRLKEVET